MSVNEITLLPQNRLVTWGENPRKETADAGGKRPKSTREFWITGTDDKTEAILAFAQVTPRMDTGVDLDTGAAIVLFRTNLAPRAMGGGVWEATITYDSSSDTMDLNFTLGTQSVNIKQALEDVACFNCKRASSTATGDLSDAATAAAGVVVDTQGTIAANVTTVSNHISAAGTGLVAKLSVAGVDPATRTAAMRLVDFATQAILNANQAKVNLIAVAANTTTAATEASAGNPGAAKDAAAQAGGASTIATAKAVAVATSYADAFDAWTTVQNGAGINAVTDDVLTQAAAVISALDTLNTNVTTGAASGTTAAAAANAVAEAAAGDIVPGGNSVAPVNRAIGVNGDEVQGCDIEVGKVEFSITKKWDRATIPAVYFQTVIDMLGGYRPPTNNATWSFTWLGVTLVFSKETLRFRNWSVKWTSQNEVEITYHFAYERSITAADNLTFGSSGKITKLGQHYLWVQYKMETVGSTPMSVPQAVWVQKVYPTDDFNKLAI